VEGRPAGESGLMVLTKKYKGKIDKDWHGFEDGSDGTTKVYFG